MISLLTVPSKIIGLMRIWSFSRKDILKALGKRPTAVIQQVTSISIDMATVQFLRQKVVIVVAFGREIRSSKHNRQKKNQLRITVQKDLKILLVVFLLSAILSL